MSNTYNVEKANNSRLIIVDDRLSEDLWRRLHLSDKLAKLIQNREPLSFNLQGEWEISGVNVAMRLNKYSKDEHFSPHKDAQYAPNGDERSLFSLLIYLNDNFEKGETKFHFSKVLPQHDVKGLTTREEIGAYGGLENDYECVTIQPKQSYAVLFTHSLLHEVMAPKTQNCLAPTERLVLRTDILVKRKEKVLGFAISKEEREDYMVN
ncbi:unnamed protein product [Rotaria magnacalcarata]|uniref:Fe2OG dioxygenase domain-containing protein n=1 Tax=Rotaria magnacalcarata TaxID=392030 RepID=A0A819NE74_9BILA|nr:unnamed protein product [Rotaria magnacalcarata]CAF1682517.1 unnamed protein product [Rotaria magnacalcarata]CAF2131299.1 unnamed protein product [Rotaria magnacalcarata]CAF2151654.1 unnamed protein product [Rotaria magnacalcarata]CAF2167604.1 unnamed protein product [Rotaria magnacalcarata]